MKTKISNLIATYRSLQEQKDSIDAHVRETAWRWVEANEQRCNYPGDKPSDSGRIQWDIKDSIVHCRWSDNWGYGSYIDGIFSFPAEMLFNEDSLAAFESECAAIEVNRQTDNKGANKQSLR